jgi:hypothetical protein
MSYPRRRRPRYRCAPVEITSLESRRLLAADYPTANEQYLVEIINRARANPSYEAARYGINLNEGVPSDETITPDPKQPLAINPLLTNAARKHSQWMLDTDTFSHDEPRAGGKTADPGARMTEAGYVFTTPWTWGENIAWNGTTGQLDPLAGTEQIHGDLFVDKNYPDRGHRVNLMNGAFREIGAAVVAGEYGGDNAVLRTHDVDA